MKDLDITGIELIPCKGGEKCPGNGKCFNKNGEVIDCCCDECDYFLFCFPETDMKRKRYKFNRSLLKLAKIKRALYNKQTT